MFRQGCSTLPTGLGTNIGLLVETGQGLSRENIVVFSSSFPSPYPYLLLSFQGVRPPVPKDLP